MINCNGSSDGSSSLMPSDRLAQPQDSMNGIPREEGDPSALTAHDGHETQGAMENGTLELSDTSSQQQHLNSTYADVVMNGIHDPMTNLAVHSPGTGSKRHQSTLPQIQEQPGLPLPPPMRLPSSQQQPQLHQQHQFTVQLNNGGIINTLQSGGEDTAEDEGSASNNGRTSRMSIDMSIDSNRANTPGAMSLSEDDCIPTGVLLGDGEGGVVTVPSDHENTSSMIAGAISLNGQHQEQRPNGIPNPVKMEQPINPNALPPPTTTTASTGHTPITGMEATAAHERQQNNNTMQLTLTPRVTTPPVDKTGARTASYSKQFLRSPKHTLERLSYILGRGTLVMINFSQRSLGYHDAELIRSAILSNPQLSVLKLGYNNLGNAGANLIAAAIQCGGGLKGRQGSSWEQKQGGSTSTPSTRQQQHRHHPSLTVLDLGFNNIGDEGCTRRS